MFVLKSNNRVKSAGLLLLEQIANTGCNFTTGLFFAKYGGLDVFSNYTALMALLFISMGPVGALTTSIISVDIVRLSVGRDKYLAVAARSAEKIVALACVVMGVSALLLALRMRLVHAELIGLAAAAYIGSSLMAELWRRIAILSGAKSQLTYYTAFRLLLTAAPLYVIARFVSPSYGMIVSIIFLPTLTFVYVAALRGRFLSSGVLRPFLLKVATGRLIIYGGWSFGATLAMMVLDQGVTIYLGYAGMSKIAGEVRAASYLFGMLNPALLLLDIMMPNILTKLMPGKFVLAKALKIVILGAMLSCVCSGLVSILSARVWLPYLGPDYVKTDGICYIVGISFACMMTRSSITPFLKTIAPSFSLVLSLIATSAGLFYFVSLSQVITAISFATTLVISSVIHLAGNLILLIATSKSQKARRAI